VASELVNLGDQILGQLPAVNLGKVREGEKLRVLDQVETRCQELQEPAAIAARFHKVANATELQPE
jgi:hypothetical protein